MEPSTERERDGLRFVFVVVRQQELLGVVEVMPTSYLGSRDRRPRRKTTDLLGVGVSFMEE
jgi:hypothetical protein